MIFYQNSKQKLDWAFCKSILTWLLQLYSCFFSFISGKNFSKKIPSLVDEVQNFPEIHTHLSFQRGIHIVNKLKRWNLLKFYFYPYTIWVCTWTVLSVPNVLLKKKFCETKRKLYAVVVTTLDHTMCTIFFPFVVFFNPLHCAY